MMPLAIVQVHITDLPVETRMLISEDITGMDDDTHIFEVVQTELRIMYYSISDTAIPGKKKFEIS